jgi:hypothetical protein
MKNILNTILNDKEVDTGNYPFFEDVDFKVVDNLPEGEYHIKEPTYIKQSTGAINIFAFAPTIIENSLGKLTIHSYAPILIRNPKTIEGYLRSNAVIEGMATKVDITAASNLELVAENVGEYNGENNHWRGIHKDAPEGNSGSIIFTNGSAKLNFGYDSSLGKYSKK